MGVRVLPSGRHQARFRYRGKDYAEVWDTAKQAEAWVQRTRRELALGTYVGQDAEDPRTGKPLPPLFRDYAAKWVEGRTLRPRTRVEYRALLPHLDPLGRYRVDQVTRDRVKGWHSALELPPTRKAHVYGLCRAILNTAVDDELIPSNPCRIKGAGRAPRVSRTELPTPVQVQQLADAMPTPKHRTMVLVAAWCGLRFGELTELRRHDIALADDGTPVTIKVRRAVAHLKGSVVVGRPKSDAGIRDVAIPPHIRADVRGYLDSVPAKPDALLFPATRTGRHMGLTSLRNPFVAARESVGLPTLRWHDLRHFSATMAAQNGATVAELMARIGHSTPAASLIYQHAVPARDQAIAEAMSNVVVLRPRAETAPTMVAEVAEVEVAEVEVAEVEVAETAPIPTTPAELEAMLDALAPPGSTQHEWIATSQGVWHMGGNTPDRGYCGKQVHMSQYPRYFTGDKPPGPVCRACRAKRERSA